MVDLEDKNGRTVLTIAVCILICVVCLEACLRSQRQGIFEEEDADHQQGYAAIGE